MTKETEIEAQVNAWFPWPDRPSDMTVRQAGAWATARRRYRNKLREVAAFEGGNNEYFPEAA